MPSFISLLEFLIVVVGITSMIALLCILLPIIYFILSIVCSIIVDKLRPKPEPPPPRPAILLSPGAFYANETPSSPRHQIFTLTPYELDADTQFDAFCVSCIHQFFHSAPFVVEQICTYSQDKTYLPKDESFTADFQRLGGSVFSPNDHTLFAVTPANHPRLYTFMDNLDRHNFSYAIFEFPTPLSDQLLSNPDFDVWHSDFSCCLSIHQHHDYVQIETQQPFSSFINPLWHTCRQMERELVLSPEMPQI